MSDWFVACVTGLSFGFAVSAWSSRTQAEVVDALRRAAKACEQRAA